MHYVNAQDDYINFQVYFILKGDKITLLTYIFQLKLKVIVTCMIGGER